MLCTQCFYNHFAPPNPKDFLTLLTTSGCPWPKATVKSPVGACNLWPLFFIFSYFLLFIFYCPAPAPALPLPLPCLALFRIFLLLPGTGGESYTGNGQFFFSFCCQGQEEKVTQGTGNFFFPFAARDRRRKLHREWAVFFFPFCCQGQKEEVTQGMGSVFFILLLPGTGGGSYTGNGYLKQDRTYTWWEAFEHMQKLLSRK